MSDYKQILQQEIQELRVKADQAQIPPELKLKVNKDIVALERSVELGSYDEKYEKVSRYLDWVLKVPWEAETPDQLDIQHTREVQRAPLGVRHCRGHYGQRQQNKNYKQKLEVRHGLSPFMSLEKKLLRSFPTSGRDRPPICLKFWPDERRVWLKGINHILRPSSIRDRNFHKNY